MVVCRDWFERYVAVGSQRKGPNPHQPETSRRTRSTGVEGRGLEEAGLREEVKDWIWALRGGVYTWNGLLLKDEGLRPQEQD